MADLNNLDWSQDAAGPDKRSDKQKAKDYMESIEYQNPNLPKKRKGNYNFPPLSEEDKERLKNCDIYGNPIKPLPEEPKQEDNVKTD